MTWCVITAGPSAGKSSTLRELGSRGYRTMPEAARILFDQAISEGRTPEEVRAEPDFQSQVEDIDRRVESNAPEDKTVFFDRSLADNLAYRRHHDNIQDMHGTVNLAAECVQRYDYIFLLDRLTFVDDEVRNEDEQEAQEIHETLRQVYHELGYDPIDVPVEPVDERADYIERQIS